MFCCTLLYVNSSIAIILMEKRDLDALLNLSSWCLMMVERLFLAVPRGCLRFVIVVFPDHTHLLFLSSAREPIIDVITDTCASLLSKPINDSNRLLQLILDSSACSKSTPKCDQHKLKTIEFQSRRLCHALHCERYKRLAVIPQRIRDKKHKNVKSNVVFQGIA